jgi:hypothetical protein
MLMVKKETLGTSSINSHTRFIIFALAFALRLSFDLVMESASLSIRRLLGCETTFSSKESDILPCYVIIHT